MTVTIFTMTHKKFKEPEDAIYVPLHVGRACSGDYGYAGDDTGDNISAKNCYYGELTGVYWVWKNVRTTDYVGICHYRRYLINEASSVKTSSIFTEPQLEKLLSDYDIITTKLLTLTCSYYDGFQENHHIKDLDTTAQVLKEKYPAYADTFETLVHGPHTYFGNIFIMRKDIFYNYCIFCIWDWDHRY